MAPTPEQSDHTSIQLRIEHWKSKSQKLNGKASIANDENLQPKSLMPFAGNPRQPMPFGLAYNLLDYIELLDWTGRQKAHSWGQDLHLPHCIACRALRDRESENFAHM